MNTGNNISFIGNGLDFFYTRGSANVYGNLQIHPHYELYLFINGKTEFVNNRIIKRLLPCHLVIIPPGNYHRFRVVNEIDKYERYFINIHTSALGEHMPKQPINKNEIILLSPDSRIAENFLYLKECFNNVQPEDFEKILQAVSTDIIYQIKYCAHSPNTVRSNFPPLSRRLIDYIDLNYTNPITLEAIAERFNYSVSHICHTFSKEFGVSVKNYIIQKRLNSAHTQISLGEKAQNAAMQNGFTDYSTFFKLYKKFYGYPPSKLK